VVEVSTFQTQELYRYCYIQIKFCLFAVSSNNTVKFAK
jgi:hypothetical protein